MIRSPTYKTNNSQKFLRSFAMNQKCYNATIFFFNNSLFLDHFCSHHISNLLIITLIVPKIVCLGFATNKKQCINQKVVSAICKRPFSLYQTPINASLVLYFTSIWFRWKWIYCPPIAHAFTITMRNKCCSLGLGARIEQKLKNMTQKFKWAFDISAHPLCALYSPWLNDARCRKGLSTKRLLSIALVTTGCS